jgi:hypothetical protein
LKEKRKTAQQIDIKRKSKAGVLRMDRDPNSRGSELFLGTMKDE